MMKQHQMSRRSSSTKWFICSFSCILHSCYVLWLAMNCHLGTYLCYVFQYILLKCSVKENHRKNWFQNLLTSKGDKVLDMSSQSSLSGVTASTSIQPSGLTAQAALNMGPGPERIWPFSRLSTSSENRWEDKWVAVLLFLTSQEICW